MITKAKDGRLPQIPAETKVLNTTDGESGTILNGFSFDTATGWTEYEVATAFGIERWLRTDFILFSAMEAAIDG